jgi:spore germination cell wall hydrolase CwlJ-like protein/GNAT superfamily N-acetyltransferase
MRAREFITESTGVRLKDLAAVKTNFPDADFWLQRKGSDKTIGTPTKEFSPENIGIKVTATDVLDARYLYYMMQHIHNTGYWKQFASGALKLVNLPLQHVANLPLGMNESLNEDENVQIKTDLTYTDSYQGQSDGFILASANGKSPWADEEDGYCPHAVGGLDFSIYEGKALIKMVQVKPEYQRLGIGIALVKRLEQEVGKGNIDWGMMTDDGKALHDKYQDLDEAFPSWAKKGALAAGGAAALAAGGLTMHNKQQQQFEPVTRVELPAAQTTQTSQQAHPVHQDPTKILAHTMWGEARDQGVPGMIAIGNVIKNRANDEAHERRFGKGIVGVATKPKQFSCWNHNDPNFKYAQEMEHLDKIIKSRKAPGGQDFNTWLKQLENTGKYLDYKLWDKSYELAKKILSGHAPDPTHGAVFYHTKDIHPYWAKGTKKLATIGKHIFYAMPKDIKESELDEYKVDNSAGLGATPNNSNVDYKGLRVLMRPSVFLKLDKKG